MHTDGKAGLVKIFDHCFACVCFRRKVIDVIASRKGKLAFDKSARCASMPKEMQMSANDPPQQRKFICQAFR